MSRNSAQRKHDLTADECQKSLVKLIQSFSHGHHLYTVFSDFVEMCALAISNGVDRTQFEAREKRYLDIVGKYKRGEVERFPQMFGLLTESFERRVHAIRNVEGSGAAMASGGLTDVLGEIYMMLDLGNARAGQFFTPYSVSRLMAVMTIGDSGEAVKRHGFMRLQEPACGAGGMVIAAAESLNDAGLNYQQAMHATCIDIDPCCVHMAYVQLSLLHIPAVVVHGNALSMQIWGMWYTPAHIMGGWRWKLRARDLAQEVAALETDSSPVSQPEVVDAQPIAEPDAAISVHEHQDVAVLERPLISEIRTDDVTPIVSLADLFEEAVEQTSSGGIFQMIDQMALF